MALRNAQGQRGKYLTRELSSTRNPVEDMCAIVSKFQSAKIGDEYYESIDVLDHAWRFEMIWLSQSERCPASRASGPEEGSYGCHQTQCWPSRLAVLARYRQLGPAHRGTVGRLACLLLL